MRWAYEGVDFEPTGVDHSSPGSSFQVGGQIVGPVFGGVQPIGPMYAFVGIAGMAKMSSSRGGVPTPADALEIMEAPLLRWLYARRRPNQAFKIAFDQEIQRLYDEWDALGAKVTAGTATPADVAAHMRAVGTATRLLPTTPRPVSYRTLASIVDMTTGDPEQTLRILSDLDPDNPVASLDETRPRLDKAERWITTQVPPEQRTHVRDEPDTELLASLDDDQRESLRLLLDGLDEHWSLDGLTTLVYGVPKRQLGLPMDTKPTKELKVAQRTFFALLYRLLVGRDTGPRLPTLLLAIGAPTGCASCSAPDRRGQERAEPRWPDRPATGVPMSLTGLTPGSSSGSVRLHRARCRVEDQRRRVRLVLEVEHAGDRVRALVERAVADPAGVPVVLDELRGSRSARSSVWST